MVKKLIQKNVIPAEAEAGIQFSWGGPGFRFSPACAKPLRRRQVGMTAKTNLQRALFQSTKLLPKSIVG
jgi:hypothetical protein